MMFKQGIFASLILIIIGLVIFYIGVLVGGWLLPVIALGLLPVGVVFLIIFIFMKPREVIAGREAIRVPKWTQNKLLNGEKVIARAGRVYATNKRLLNCNNRFDSRTLEYDRISDITYEKHGISRKIAFIILLFICSLIFILLIPDMLGHPYKIGEAWVRPFSGFLGSPLLATITLLATSFFVLIIIFMFPFSYYQIKCPDFDNEYLRYWRFDVPRLFNGKINRFIEIIKKQSGISIEE